MQDENLLNAKNINAFTTNGQEISVTSSYVKENLPLPFVLYPDHYGTFIGFSEEMGSTVYFCACSQTAIVNYFRFLKDEPSMIVSLDFPPSIFQDNQNWSNVLLPEFLGKINFKEGICHKCNFAIPTRIALHPMYGGRFKQSYDWYINQQYFHLGIHHGKILEDICPPEICEMLARWRIAGEDTQREYDKLMVLFNSPKRLDIGSDVPQYMKNVTMPEAEVYQKLQRESGSLYLKFTNFIENIVRADFGYRKIGEGWISESILHKIILKIFPEIEILRHHRPDWLKGLELDIFIPELKIGFEYQGKQHYFPISAWGGEKALKRVQERDLLKKEICKTLGINLVIVNYNEPLTEEHVRQLLFLNLNIP